MKMTVILFILTIFSFISCAQNKAPLGVEEKNERTSFSTDYRCISLHAILNDSISGEFALDNGMDALMLDSVFFYSNFDTSKYTRTKKESNYYFKQQSYEGIISVSIGTYTFSTNNFLVKNCHSLGIPELKGIVSVDAFINKITTIDFDNQTISFLDTLPDTTFYFKMPLLRPKNNRDRAASKCIEIDFWGNNGKIISGHMQFDLGCVGADIVVKKPFAKRVRKAEAGATGKALLFTFQKVNVKNWNLDSISISNCIVKNATMTTTSISVPNDPDADAMLLYDEGDGYMGFNLIRKFNIIADYKNNVLYLQPNSYFQANFSR